VSSDPIKFHPQLSPESREVITDLLGDMSTLPAHRTEAGAAFKTLNISAQELRGCGGFVPGERSRHEIARSEAWVMLAIFWDGVKSPIHDHDESDCGFRVIDGEVEEMRYKVIEDDLVEPIATRILREGEFGKSVGSAIHTLGVPGPESGRQAITLHLYCPILGYDAMGIYQEIEASEGADSAYEPSEGRSRSDR